MYIFIKTSGICVRFSKKCMSVLTKKGEKYCRHGSCLSCHLSVCQLKHCSLTCQETCPFTKSLQLCQLPRFYHDPELKPAQRSERRNLTLYSVILLKSFFNWERSIRSVTTSKIHCDGMGVLVSVQVVLSEHWMKPGGLQYGQCRARAVQFTKDASLGIKQAPRDLCVCLSTGWLPSTHWK